MKLYIPILAAFTLPQVAFANCPTESDLVNGIMVIESDGTEHLFVSASADTVFNFIVTADGYETRNTLVRGTYVLELVELETGRTVPDTMSRTRYAVPVSSIPTPSANTRGDFQTVVTGYGEDLQEKQSYAWGQEGTITIGECSYTMIPGKIRYENSDYFAIEGLYYLPALGISLLHEYSDSDFPTPDRYTFARIEAAQ